MKYRQLGRTDIKVSSVCLGNMTWGQQNSEREAHKQLDFAIEQGINFIDTAPVYPLPPTIETQGRSEAYLGSWSKLKEQRDKMILISKVAGPGIDMLDDKSYFFTRESISKSLEESLVRLQTDYLDIFMIHWPERNNNRFGQREFAWKEGEVFTPLEEVLGHLEELKKQGKIREIGISNESPWGFMEYLKISQYTEAPRPCCIQNPLNLLNRIFELGLSEISLREECGLVAYSPLGFGVLTGKYLGGQRPEGSRLVLYDHLKRYAGAETLKATKAYVDLAKRYSVSPIAMALQFVHSQPFVTSVLFGATSVAQLKENLAHLEAPLPKEIYQEIDIIHQHIPNPAP